MSKDNRTFLSLSWDDVFTALHPIDILDKSVYGIPKGGMIASAFLRKAKAVTDPFLADIILDDVVDSGRTMQRYKSLYPDKPFHCLINKQTLGTKQWVVFPWEVESHSVEDNVVRVLQYLGEDITRPGLKDTPARVVRSWSELFRGYSIDPTKLVTTFDEGDKFDEIVLLRNIELFSTCEHHMLPFFGKAHVAYLPGRKGLVGISKLARLVEAYSRRLQIQERIGKQIARFLMDEVQAQGAACIIEATHLCMRMRGVNKQNSVMVTSSMEGIFRTDASARAELLKLIGNG